MKFLLDANLPYSGKEIFSPSDEVFHVRDLDLQHAPDDLIAKWAKANKAIIISRDLDFGNIKLMPLSSHHGAVILRIPDSYTSSSIKRVLKGFLENIDHSALVKALVIVEEGSYRIRNE